MVNKKLALLVVFVVAYLLIGLGTPVIGISMYTYQKVLLSGFVTFLAWVMDR